MVRFMAKADGTIEPIKNCDTKDYIVVHQNKTPLIIYKQHIQAVTQDLANQAVIYVADGHFSTDEKYSDVIKMLI